MVIAYSGGSTRFCLFGRRDQGCVALRSCAFTLAAIIFTLLTTLDCFSQALNAPTPVASPVPPVSSLPALTPLPVQPVTPGVPSSGPITPPGAPEIITIIHRLSGWKLAAWFAWNDAELTNAFNDDFVHTKFVAGCLLGDGRTVVARLPQAEIEARARMMPERFQREAAVNFADALMIVRRNGEQRRLNFVGLDGRTGLSLLEIETQSVNARQSETGTEANRAATVNVRQMPPALNENANDEDARPSIILANSRDITVGQQLRLLAPQRVNAPVSDRGSIIRLRINETGGRVTQLARTQTGEVANISLHTEGFLPAFAGAVAITETGALAGIVEGGERGEARLLSVDEIRRATLRVLARRTSVPQPWLGARGREISLIGLEQLMANGWRLEQARAVLESRQGVLLTAIAPRTPAALAGLRPGDVIVRVGEQSVQGVEDFSSLLREAVVRRPRNVIFLSRPYTRMLALNASLLRRFAPHVNRAFFLNLSLK